LAGSSEFQNSLHRFDYGVGLFTAGTVLEILSGDLLSLFMGIGYWAASFGYIYLWRPIARLTIVTAQR